MAEVGWRPVDDADPPLRILVLTSEAPPVVSGVSSTVAALTKGLTQRGHSVQVISRADFPRFMRREIRISAFALFWRRFRNELQHYDVVNVHGPVPTISEVFLLLSQTVTRVNRPGIVYTHHSDLAIPRLERWCSIYNRLSGRLAHTADVVVVSSIAYKEKVERIQGAPVEVVPWGVDSRAKVQPRSERLPSQLRVLFVGQLRPYKGLPVLLDAMHQLPQARLTIVGAGPSRRELDEQVARLGLTNVVFTGRLTDQELWQAYSAHDVIVLPSTTRAEAYGLVLAEGMAAGCVPVASNLPGVREVAAPTGLLVTPGSVHELRDALWQLATNRALLERLALASRQRGGELSIESTAARYDAVFRHALDKATGHQARLALPDHWASPALLLGELSARLGVRHVSLSLLSVPRKGQALSPLRVWRLDGAPMRTEQALVAEYVASRNRPLLISPATRPDDELAALLLRPEITSSIVLPTHRTRNTISVIGLSTSTRDATYLEQKHIDLTESIVASRPAQLTPGWQSD